MVTSGSACKPAVDHESRRAVDLEVGRRVADLRRALDSRAARARDRLEAARADAETALARGARDRGLDPGAAQAQARRALEEGAAVQGEEPPARIAGGARGALEAGAAVVEAAARDGSEAAAGWARVIQDRMMRLQQSIRSPGDADGLSKDS